MFNALVISKQYSTPKARNSQALAVLLDTVSPPGGLKYLVAQKKRKRNHSYINKHSRVYHLQFKLSVCIFLMLRKHNGEMHAQKVGICHYLLISTSYCFCGFFFLKCSTFTASAPAHILYQHPMHVVYQQYVAIFFY